MNSHVFRLAVTVVGAVGFAGRECANAQSFTEVQAGFAGVANGSAVAWGDYDDDGDLDLALAGQSDAGKVAKVYQNQGGAFVDIGAALTGVSECSLAWGDYDNDGDLDLALAGADQSTMRVAIIYRNDGGVFTDIGASLDGVWRCSLAWGDYDNDGDLDLVLAGYNGNSEYVSIIYANGGNDSFADIGAGLLGVKRCSTTWADYDNDGDLDLALAGGSEDVTWHPETKIYRNDGGGSFTDIGAPLPKVNNCALAWGDYDNDGDLDLALAGTVAGGRTAGIYRNDNGTFADTGAALTGVDFCALAWGDCDNDGDLDLALAGYVGTGNVSKIYRNNSGVFVDVGAPLEAVFKGPMAWGDYDNDGDLDLLLAGYGPTWVKVTKLYSNDGVVLNTLPAAPDGLAVSVAGSATTFCWNASTDNETLPPGLSYNLRVGTTPGTDDVLTGMARVMSGFRHLPALGNAQQRLCWTLIDLADGTYYWSVQAVDTAFAGSPWAPEMAATLSPADVDGDGDVDVDDYAALADCWGGPNAPPSPTPPTTMQDCLDAFDFNDTRGVDLLDFAVFAGLFTG